MPLYFIILAVSYSLQYTGSKERFQHPSQDVRVVWGPERHKGRKCLQRLNLSLRTKVMGIVFFPVGMVGSGGGETD